MVAKIKRLLRSLILLTKEEKKIPISTPVNTNELLKGKIALITGGSGGIGLAMATSFLSSGAKVIIAGTREEKLRSCSEKIGEKDNLAHMVIDVTDVKSLPGKVKTAALPERRKPA